MSDSDVMTPFAENVAGLDIEEDELLFADKAGSEEPENEEETWKVLVSDDDESVHIVTKLVLSNYTFDGRNLKLMSVYSGEDTKKIVAENPDIAVILLDVVMEREDAGLEVVRFIRDELKNKFVRIILRTGQPGQAPENKVIMDYDINDYKEKTELTAQKLVTAMTAALRSYRDICIINKSRKGLEQIIEASSGLFEPQSLTSLASGVLVQLTSLLHLKDQALYIHSSGFAAANNNGELYIIAATGVYEQYVARMARDVLDESVVSKLEMACREKCSVFFDDSYVGYFKTSNGSENLLFLQGWNRLDEFEKDLIKIFASNVSIAFDNVFLNMEIVDTQKEVIFTLGEVVETRSKETANHARRMSMYSALLASKLGMDSEEVEMIRLASPMHDIGKIGIPDSILQKPGKLTHEEFEIIKSHTLLGYEILSKSTRKIMKTAAIIALQHHEHWDGMGYPKGLKGEEIHLYGRITCLTDVFDALGHKRVYKDAWEMNQVIKYIIEQRGKLFDPAMVDLFLNNIDEVLVIKMAYPDND